MNRLVIIGNGFDLAHGLKTSYNDFLDFLWEKIYEELMLESKNSFIDTNYKIEIKTNYEKGFLINSLSNYDDKMRLILY